MDATAAFAIVCENCSVAAPIKDAKSPSGPYRPENVILTAEELAELGWLESGSGWLCPECAPAQ